MKTKVPAIRSDLNLDGIDNILLFVALIWVAILVCATIVRYRRLRNFLNFPATDPNTTQAPGQAATPTAAKKSPTGAHR